MCIRIAFADGVQDRVTWDPDEITIFVQGGTHTHDLIRDVHALLADLGAPTATAGLPGLRCFCGDPVDLPTEATPASASTL